MNADALKDVIPHDAQSAEIMQMWKDRMAGKITHEQQENRLKEMFSGRMMELWRLWLNGGLFISQTFRTLDQFLKMDERDWKRDAGLYYEFVGVASLTKETNPEIEKVKQHYRKWISSTMDYRKQFLDQQGNPVRHMEDKEGEKEYDRLKQLFF